MTTLRTILWTAAILALSISPSSSTAAESSAAGAELPIEKVTIERWQLERAQELKSDTGWLSLVGLFWLQEGETTLGRDATNVISVHNPALARAAGSFVRARQSVRFIAKSRGGITHDGKPVTSIELVADTGGEPTSLESGSLSFILIERAGRLGIRVRDQHNPARVSFKGLEYFPVTLDWVFDASFEPYSPKRWITIVNILGMEVPMECPGAVVFTREGRQFRLDAVLEEPGADELFVMFADRTSGKETYGAGRFLYLDLPRNGRVRLDFNMAHNPPCAFSHFATCPLPPPQNRLSLRIDAGEKTYELTHRGALPGGGLIR